MEGFRPYPEELVREYKENKWWLETNFIDALSRTCDLYPHKEAVVEGATRLTFSELMESSRRAALAFLELGLGPGSIVLHQIPNWVESLVVYTGLQTIGAIPVMCLPRHGQRELESFCELTGATAWFGPATFGRVEYVPWLRAIQERHAHLKHVVVARDEAPAGTLSLSKLMAETRVDGDYLSTEEITSNIADRVMRVRCAMRLSPNAIAGSSACRTASAKSSVGDSNPLDGSQPSTRENNRISTMPQKKSGRLMPASAALLQTVSCHRFCQIALITPNGIASTIAMISDNTTIRPLASIFWPISLAIGSLKRSEVPKSPCTKPPIQRPY